MQNDPLFYVVAIAMILVVVILMIGITGMARGGEFNRKNANRLMRYRIIAQFIAVILILIFVATRFAGN
ncbi:twin transmembrane helix small protein [Qingshengfaniella alkalisoli]|uniref:Twin transmembrane helix small protein n=1 Tax=Qingshengfaniella alkalisoli TaxID=2599296 RepID=A0A5B8I4Z1_9RHOB|nr:twin transmembrane helix small protein [Qingshengfaniella alkalisoli]QDY68279.1 twin transmembrane helix small protein [Qingshengfaniella alkalisoli]